MSDADIVRMLGISGQPQGYIPFVRKCFRGVQSILFGVTTPVSSETEQETSVNMMLELNSTR